MRRNIGGSGGKVTKKYPASRLGLHHNNISQSRGCVFIEGPTRLPRQWAGLIFGFSKYSCSSWWVYYKYYDYYYRRWDATKCIAINLQSIAGFFASIIGLPLLYVCSE